MKRRAIARPASPFDGLITRSLLDRTAGQKYFERGVDYFEQGAVVHLATDEHGIIARVQGTAPCPYLVRFWIERKRLRWGCACPIGSEGAFCKHLVATGLAWIASENVADTQPPTEGEATLRGWLSAIGREPLIELISARAEWDDEMLAEIALAVRASRHRVPEARARSSHSPTPKRHR